jgi:hypothetical protein
VKQSNLMSFMESMINIVVGFGLSCAAQAIFLPMLGVSVPWHANLIFAVIMTALSVARSFALRRLFEAMHIRRRLSPFMQAVVAERFRQIEAEGWSQDHDDKYAGGVLAVAGAAYALGARLRAQGLQVTDPPSCWPWSRDWWKPTDMRRDLVKACALMIAEGERIDHRRQRRVLPDAPSRVPMPPVRPTLGAGRA